MSKKKNGMTPIEDLAIYELYNKKDFEKREAAKKKKKDNAAKYGGMDFPRSGTGRKKTTKINKGGKVMMGYKAGGKV